MNHLQFFMLLATMQDTLGRAVRVIDITREYSIPRQSVYLYINALIKSNYVTKTGRGLYMISVNENSMRLGFCVLKPMDVYQRASMAQNHWDNA